MDQQDQRPQLGIVLLQTPASSTFHADVVGVVAALAAGGLTAVLEGTVLRVDHDGSSVVVTPEPAPLSFNDAFTPWIEVHADPAVLRARYGAHTGLIGVRTEPGGDPAAARRLLLEVVRLTASHRTATVVISAGDAAFWTAEQVRGWPSYLGPAPVAEPRPATVGRPVPVRQPVPAAPPGSPAAGTLVAHVLLGTVPGSMGEVVAPLDARRGADLAREPLVPRLAVTVDGRAVLLGATGTPLPDGACRRDLAVSPVRSLVEPAVAAHRAWVGVTVEVGDDWHAAATVLATVVATVSRREDAQVVWSPQQASVTTDVLFQHDVADRPELVFARVHAMWHDAEGGPAVAFTQGLAALGGTEVQLYAHGVSPAQLFEDLREAVAGALAARALPREGGTLTVAGFVLTAVAATSEWTGGPVLDLRA